RRRRVPRARGLRHVRRRVRRAPRPAPDSDARGLRGVPPAPRLPDRRRAGAVHLQRRGIVREGHVMASLTEDYRKREESITYSAEPVGEGETHELMTLNIGPHHPATHGVLRLITTLEGEVVR